MNNLKKKIISLGILFLMIFQLWANAFILNIWWKNYNISAEAYSSIIFAKKNWITNLNVVKNIEYFSNTSTRFVAALMLTRFAKNVLHKKYIKSENECIFNDIYNLPVIDQSQIIESCRLWLFKWDNWKFMPWNKFYKSSLIVVLDRILKNNPNIELTQAVWDLASIGIIKDTTNIYRPATKWELFILVKRWYNYLKENNLLDNKNNSNSWSNNLNNSDLTLWESWWNNSNNNSNNWIWDILSWILWNDNNSSDNSNTTTWNNSNTTTWNNSNTTTWNNENTTTWNNENTTTWNNENTTISTWNDNTIENLTWKVEKNEITYKNGLYSSAPSGVDNLVVEQINFNIKNKNDINISKLDLILKWLNDRQLIKNVYLTNSDYEMITYEKSFNSDRKATLTFKRWFEFKTWDNLIYLVVDLYSNYSNQNFAIQWTFDWTVKNTSGDLTFTTKSLDVINYNSQKITVDGYVGVPSQKIYVWDKWKLIWTFRLTVWSNWNNTSAVEINKIILENKWNSLDDIVQNIVLKDDENNKIADCKVSNIDKDKVVCWTTLNMSDWQTKLINIYWDIIGGENDTIEFNIDPGRDIVAFETKNNVPIQTIIWSTATSFKIFTIQAGKLTISKVSTSPVWTTLPADSNNQEILRFKINAPSLINIDEFQPLITITNNWIKNIQIKKVFDAIKLYKCDKNYSSCTIIDSMDYSDAIVNTWNTYSFRVKSYLSQINKWDNYYSIKIDLSRYSNDIKTSAKIDTNSLITPENENGDRINSSDIVWEASSSYFTVWESNLTLSYSNDSLLEYVEWKTENYAWEITLSNSNIENIKLISLRLHFKSDNTSVTNYNQITNVKLVDENWKEIAKKDSDANWYVYFDSLNYIIPKWETKKIKVIFDTNTNLFTNTNIHQLKFSIDSVNSSDILFTTSNWLVLDSDNINWIPLTSSPIKFYPYGKIYLFRDSNTPEDQIVYDTNKYTKVYSFKLKSRYDDIQISDAYIVAISWDKMKYEVNIASWDLITWTQNYVNQISLKMDNQIKEAPLVDWIARFLWIDYKIPANEEKTLEVWLKPNNVTSINYDNKKLRLALVLKIIENDWIKKTKFISLSNWEELDNNYIMTWDDILSKLQIVRWWMISIDDANDENRTEVAANGSDYDLFAVKVSNLSATKTEKVKQLTFKVSLANWGSEVAKLNNFELYVSSDNWDS